MIRYNIIATGSKGNAVKIDDILIDCGVSFKKLKDVYKHIRLVLLTNTNTLDHFRPSTIRKLAAERPTLRFGCCRWMVPKLIECGVSPTQIDVYDIGKDTIIRCLLCRLSNYIMTFRTADIGYISDERECCTQQIPEQCRVSAQRI